MDRAPQKRAGRVLWFAFPLIMATVGAVALVGASVILRDRRVMLLAEAQREVAASVEAVAALVNDRGRDIHDDLILASEVRQHAESSREVKLQIVRSHLISLNRSAKHYLKLWYLEDGKVATEVSGFRASPLPVPEIPSAELAEVDRRARAEPGTIAAMQALVPIDSPYDSLRLLGLATREGDATVAVLVNMDAVFDALQTRARLPGLELWVVDLDGSVLVDPDSPRRREVLDALLSGGSNGAKLLGPEPSLWPFSDVGADSQMVAWRTVPRQPFPWITAVATPLAAVTASLHELGLKLLSACIVGLMLLAGAAALVLWLAQQKSELDERVHSLSTISELREQLLHLEKLSTLGQVAAGIAHEMGTPLGVIAIRAEQLREQLTDERQRAALAVVQEQVQRIDRVMRQLLKSARPAQVEPRMLLVQPVVQQVVELVAHRFEQHGVALEVGLLESLHVWHDADEMQQVFLNLLVNACDACRRGDRVSVAAAPTDGEGRVGVEVRDTGPGMTPEVLSSVFEPFFTTKPPGQGTGLGLTIVREIMQRHGGRVTVTSSDSGTRFVCYFRVEPETLGAGASIGAEERAS